MGFNVDIVRLYLPQIKYGSDLDRAVQALENMENKNTSTNSDMVPCQLWPNPNGCCPVGRVECYKYTACQVAQHQ